MQRKTADHSITAPIIPHDLAPLAVHVADAVEEISEASIDGAQLIGMQRSGLRISLSRLTKVNLTDGGLPYLQAGDLEFDECNLSNLKAHGASFSRVIFAQSKLAGMQAARSTFNDVEFRECRLEFASFADVKFKRVLFRDCQIRDADFTNATFENVQFENCDLTRTTFSGMRIQQSQMRRCTLSGVRGLAELRGVAMEASDILTNAELFATELGIRVI